MADDVKWTLDLVDKMSGPLDAVDKALKSTGKSLKEVDGAIAKVEKQMKLDAITKAKDPLQKQALALKMVREESSKAAGEGKSFLGEWAKGGIAAGITQTLAERVFLLKDRVLELGKAFLENAVQQSEYRKETIRSLDTTLGGLDKASDAYSKLDRIAANSKRTRGEVVASFQDLVEQGFSAKNAEDVVEAANDLGAKRGAGAQNAFLDTFKKVLASQSNMKGGVFDSASLDAIKTMGLGPGAQDQFLKTIAAQHKTTVRGAKNLIDSGVIKAQESLQAMFDLVQNNANEGKGVGFAAKEVADNTLSIQLKNLRDNFDKLFESGNGAPIAKAVKSLSDMLDPATDKGKKLQATVEKAFTAVGAFVEKIASDPQKVSDAIDTVIGAFEVAFDLFKVAKDVVGGIWSAWNGAIDGVGKAIFSVSDAFANLSAKWEAFDMVASGTKLAKDFFIGLLDGIAKGTFAALDAMKGLGDGMISGLKNKLGIHSPSKVMMELGGFTAKGFALGVEKSPMPKLDAFNPELPRLNVPSPQLASNTNSTTNTNSNRSSITIGDIHVGPQGGLTGDATADGKVIGEAIRAEMVRLFEGVAIESGGMGTAA